MRELEKRISIKRCNEDEGGCGHPASMQQTLKGQQPLAFLIQLGWDLKATGKHMRGTMELFREVLLTQTQMTFLLHLDDWSLIV